jgi:hypothetical protein
MMLLLMMTMMLPTITIDCNYPDQHDHHTLHHHLSIFPPRCIALSQVPLFELGRLHFIGRSASNKIMILREEL